MRLASAPLLTAFACALMALAKASDARAQEPAAAAAAPPAASEPRERARLLANQAADAIARGEHEQAEELLRQAYAHYPAPTIALLHARTLLHLQRLSTAVSVYERATLTSLGPDAPCAAGRPQTRRSV